MFSSFFQNKQLSFALKLVVFSAPLLISFQNCSQPGEIVMQAKVEALQAPVTETPTDNVGDNSGNNGGEVVDQRPNDSSEIFTKAFTAAPIDILFVLDDSSSMNAIIANVRQGFDSIAKSNYPDGTKMATTYMSPARYTSDTEFDIEKSWYEKSVHTPGYIKLVNKASIESYQAWAAINEKSDNKNKANVTIAGCEQTWFSPSDVTADGDTCLKAATQAPFYQTGAEAGVVSLSQLLKTLDKKGNSLFRENSFANIIFVSDTHEPGTNYWGKEGALKAQLSVVEILDQIHKNSKKLNSVKFHGIVPLPAVNDPLLAGLRTVGSLPQTAAESKISGEDLYDFSYLPFIKSTNGLASHPSNSDWSAIASQIVADSVYTGSLSVEVKYPIDQLIKVTVDGVEVDANKIQISDSRTTIFLEYRSHSSQNLEIKVDYKVKK